MNAILDKTKGFAFQKPEKFLRLAEDMFSEKHILIYTEDPKLSEIVLEKELGGNIPEFEVGKDLLFWVDANLAALKTDHALNRSLGYSIKKEENNYISTASMRYLHTGNFDWRTSRYRTYARVFVPPGSTIKNVYSTDRQGNKTLISLDDVEEGNELGYRWFGVFYVIEPGHEQTLTFEYNIDREVVELINSGNYKLEVPKQLGTINHGLTLLLDFGKNVTAAIPPEAQSNWGDGVYEFSTNLRTNKLFNIGL